MSRPILTRIAGKFQVTVPTEIRELFELREGDLFQWEYDEASSEIRLLPKRAQLLTPQTRKQIEAVRAAMDKADADRAKVTESDTGSELDGNDSARLPSGTGGIPA